MDSSFRKKLWVGIAWVIMLSGCKVGPDFQAPAAPQTSRYTEKPIPQKTVSAPTPGGKSQQLIYGQDIPAEWWTLFHSADLNRLVVQGIANSPTLEAAQAALRQAAQNLRAEQGQLFPQADLAAAAIRQRTSGASFGAPTAASSTFNLFNTQVNVAYTLDVFGGIRRQIEANSAQVDNQRYEWYATYLTLTANIVTTAITEASLRAQIATTLQLINEQEQTLQIVKQQFALGGASAENVLTQATQLAQIRATLPPLQKRLAQNRNALAVLVGQLPSQSYLPAFYLSALNLPHDIPVSIPSDLVRQRPDVQAAEALLHAASAQIGVATANLLPQITLSGGYGWVGTELANLFTHQNSVWSYGAGLLQPIFHGGTLVAQRRADIAAYDQALAQYQQIVLQAFQNVADSLNALEIDARTLRAQAQAENSAHSNFTLTRDQYRLGAVSYLTLLTAELQYERAVLNRVQAEAARYTDTAALFQSLGGGWWHLPPPSLERPPGKPI